MRLCFVLCHIIWFMVSYLFWVEVFSRALRHIRVNTQISPLSNQTTMFCCTRFFFLLAVPVLVQWRYRQRTAVHINGPDEKRILFRRLVVGKWYRHAAVCVVPISIGPNWMQSRRTIKMQMFRQRLATRAVAAAVEVCTVKMIWMLCTRSKWKTPVRLIDTDLSHKLGAVQRYFKAYKSKISL